ncbi:MAG: transcription termination/antitermination protein NusA [Lachnospiraceae bacterium]|nr:transcription termination/antitermination protein NusA [Lachnospiraceae bacterium]MBP3608975.1 transcription termination/antitermination protein NusA [Lachnospiraceae bacterium]
MSANKELLEALNQIEKEKDISKEILLEAIENSLLAACKNQYGKADNIKVMIDRETGAFNVYAEKEIVEEVEDEVVQISLAEAKLKFPRKTLEIGDIVNIEVTPKNFGRIAAQKAKQVVVQKIREEERKALYNQYQTKERDIVTGIVQRYQGNNISINLGKVDAILTENEQIRGEYFRPNDRVKLYVLKVEDTTRGPRITVSRTHPELVKRLFEAEVTEVKDGTVEIKSISREAGARTKMAVYSNDPNVDPVGACVGVNGARVNTIVEELRGEKIDIINWSEDPAALIENALSPAKVVSVDVDTEEKSARVIVPDYQLSLAIGREGQNARLAARLTGYKIDIKSESQAGTYYEDWNNKEQYNDQYDEEYEEEYDGQYNDQYEDEYADSYDGQYDEQYEEEYDDEYNEEYSDEQ